MEGEEEDGVGEEEGDGVVGLVEEDGVEEVDVAIGGTETFTLTLRGGLTPTTM